VKKSPSAKPSPGKPPRGRYVLKLFIAGNGSNSKLASINLRRICQEHLKDRFTVETVDVVKDLEAAVRHNILVTPALLMIAPSPKVVILGNLNDSQKVLLALRLNGHQA
jgi:circadian clock protein KaiB